MNVTNPRHSAPPLDVAIVGGGIGGLTLALMLHASGVPCRVRVYEAVPEIKALGVGINIQAHAMRELSLLGLEDALRRVSVEPKEQLFFSHHGQLIFQEPVGVAAGSPYPHFSIHRGELHMVLLDAVRERLGSAAVVTGYRCVRADQSDDDVVLQFVDPAGSAREPVRADVAVACDGINSTLREQFYPAEGAPVYHGINMWRGVTRARPFLGGASATRIGGLQTTNKLVVYPIRNDIDGTGTQLINWVAEAVTNVRESVDWSKTGRLEDFFHFYAGWTFDWLDAAGLLRDAEFILSYPMVDRDPVARWSFGRITLLGDAAHPMYPRGGNGAAQAIVDARAIVESLLSEPHPMAAFKAYEAARLPATSKIVLMNREAPPDLIIDTVERLTGGKRFDNIDDVIDRGELQAIADAYHNATAVRAPR
jgi:2-polyprenyl-6-methoxyphenol hydroxylase-like FAD-dependent oxidoreductase